MSLEGFRQGRSKWSSEALMKQAREVYGEFTPFEQRIIAEATKGTPHAQSSDRAKLQDVVKQPQAKKSKTIVEKTVEAAATEKTK